MKILSRLKRFKNFTRKAVITTVLVAVAVVGVAINNNSVNAANIIPDWNVSPSATTSCASDGSGAKITVSFRNNEPVTSSNFWSMNVTATDKQTGKFIKMGTVAAQHSTSGTIQTDKDTLNDGRVQFKLTWEDPQNTITPNPDYSHFAKYQAVHNCKSTPTPPNYTIEKQVRIDDSAHTNDWQKLLKNVDPGTLVQYRIVVNVTGKKPSKEIVVAVKDQLPASDTYVPNSLTHNGQLADEAKFFGINGITDNVKAGDTITYIFNAIVGKGDSMHACHKSNNVATISSSNGSTKESHAYIHELCKQQPTPTPTPTCTPTPTVYWNNKVK